MNKKKKANGNAFVFSTDPDFRFHNDPMRTEDTLPAAGQNLRIWLETRHRGGKAVTIIEGFSGKTEDLHDLEKKLKTFCGTGGSIKEGNILIQGDQRDKVFQWLQKNGYQKLRKL